MVGESGYPGKCECAVRPRVAVCLRTRRAAGLRDGATVVRKSRRPGDANGQFGRDSVYLRTLGQGVPEDDAQAAKWFQKAAIQGQELAQYALAGLYDSGQGVPKDDAQAVKWYEKAAAQGNAKAQDRLGRLADLPTLRTQATQGDARAQLQLGGLYATGEGVPQDYAIARQCYEKAAAQGDALAQTSLGVLYANGRGVPQDYTKARQWYEKAAAQGEAGAQYNLGELYHDGQGVPQDYAKAREWFMKAAAQGEAQAQHNLGVMYVYGRSVPKNYVRAYMWESLAAARLTGVQQRFAAENRDEIARRMTPAQIAEAQRLSQLCQTRQFKGC